MLLLLSLAVLLIAIQQAALAVRAYASGGLREALFPLGGALLAGTQAALLYGVA